MRSGTKNQKGFGVVEVLLIIVLLGLLGLIGWQVYQANMSSTDKNNDSAHTQPAPAESPKEDLLVYKNEELGIQFSYPVSFKVDQEYPNGVSLKSKDFASEVGLQGISKGGVITVTVNEETVVKGEGTGEDREKQALVMANETPNNQEALKIAGIDALKFEYNTGENRNQHQAALFFKKGYRYEINYQFTIEGKDPYPRLFDTVTDSFRLQ